LKKKQRIDNQDRDGATKREPSELNVTRGKTKRRAVSRLMAFYNKNPLPIPSVSKGKWKKLLTDSETINQKAGDQHAPTQNTKGKKNTSKGKKRNQTSTGKDQAKMNQGKRKRKKSSKNNENNQKSSKKIETSKNEGKNRKKKRKQNLKK